MVMPFEEIKRELDAGEMPSELAIDALEKWFKERIQFHLTYTRDERRYFHGGGLDGQQIPNSYWSEEREGTGEFNPKSAPGEWCHDEMWRECTSEEEAIRAAFRVAISEVVHEALEWFKVDGRPFLDPHAEDEDLIIFKSIAFADELFALAVQSDDEMIQ